MRCSARHFDMVVCHYRKIVLVHPIEKFRYVGEQVGVYLITRTRRVGRRTTPVGVDDEVIEIKIVIVVFLNHRFRAFFGILVISRLPQSESRQRNHRRSAGEFYVFAAQFFCIAAGGYKINILHSFIDDKAT